eukprot:gnl/Hemi2/4322_TR1521_c0_g1_i1.p1 gnl/Hemi2/4322_TR1521_c0_g1~~gnl/Hemi2/4322_TR1521_c0_g1_i1.p1  ORF type:complete len:537 (-),score=184.87 gnl/Hemi2/4322_TR1521_c0_g1_i1:112-1722(-)
MAVKFLNANADVTSRGQALLMTCNAGKGLKDVLSSNLGPKGTMKMLVDGSGGIKITKDGKTLLHEMQIQNPTACLIARTATAQDDITGDGTTTNVIFIGELLKQAEKHLGEGIHPRVLTLGFELAQTKALEILNSMKLNKTIDRELLTCVARTVLRTKVSEKLADQLTEFVVDAVLCIKKEGEPIDLHMIEIMHMEHQTDSDTKLIKGLVMDHGARHPEMPKRLTNCYIMTCNVSLEYEKSELNAEFNWNSAEKRENLTKAEREFVDDHVRKVIELKRRVCSGDKKDYGFCVVNQKGIDPAALDMLAKEGILGLRRAKRRNMERLVLACGGTAVNSVEGLEPDVLGFAGNVYEQVLGEEKYTFVENVRNPFSCTILVKGPNKHTIEQIKDAIRDGVRAVKNTIEDNCVLPGAGAFELAASEQLKEYARTVTGRAKLGVLAFAEALLVVPKTLSDNSGLDTHDVIIRLQEEAAKGHKVGLDLVSGEPMDPEDAGIYDNFRVKRQILHSSPVIASQLLLVDELIRAGKGGKSNKAPTA